ncbi:PIN domain-containing protein [Geoglobus acetivorans]
MVIDTNVFIYAILQDSEFHRQARDFLASLDR